MSSHEIPVTPEKRIKAARDYRAALHNPKVSEEAKGHAQQRLLELNDEEARHELYNEVVNHVPYDRNRECRLSDERQRSPQERINAARGFKAALHNPLVSEEGKEGAHRMLEEMDDEEARQELYSVSEKPKDPKRVDAGLKAEEGHHRAVEKFHAMGYYNP